MNLRSFAVQWFCALALLAKTAAAGGLTLHTSTFVGGGGDAVEGVAIQSDGTLVVAANVSKGPFVAGNLRVLGEGKGMVYRLSADGTKVLSGTRVASQVRDLDLDGADGIYVATDDGAMKLTPAADRIVWKQGACQRIDAGEDGVCATLRYSRDDEASTGKGDLVVLDPQGKVVGQFGGFRNTLDVCVDSASKTVVHIGWRQANAWDGKRKFPVQIAYLRGRSYTGDEKYLLYDWPTDREEPGFLNKATNNMADTRGYRCSIGRDGLLYGAFECAGGNHIFRWEPKLVDGQWAKAGAKKPKGDQHHGFHNSRAEHKTFMARYRPGTGEYVLGQEFCGRLSSGRANAVRVEHGAITAAADSTVLVGGASAYGLPVSFLPPGTGEYTGGSFVLAMKPDLTGRLACVRFNPGGHTHAVDARRVKGRLVVVAGGRNNKKSADEVYTKNAIQPEGEPASGFLAVLVEQ